MPQDTTIREAFLRASSLLQDRFEAELLLRSALELDRAQFYARLSEPFSGKNQATFQKYLTRRLQGEPLQYIIGDVEFYGRTFHVNPAVLIPRPETEVVLEKLLKHAKHIKKAPHVIEVGTGSGIIAITLALEKPDWQITTIDISQEALIVAKQNAKLHGVKEKINWINNNYLPTALEKIDILISNPPYIPSDVITTLDTQVKDYEPKLALDGGRDGLDAYRIIMQQLKIGNHKPQLICFEIGSEQANAVAAIIRETFEQMQITIYQDLAGRDRVVIAF